MTDIEALREHIEKHGVETLKDYELLAIILGTGSNGQNALKLNQAILSAHPIGELVRKGLEELSSLKGFGIIRSSILLAACEFCRRGLQKDIGVFPVVSSPEDLLPLLTDIKEQNREHLLALFLNARNQVIHKDVVMIGNVSAFVIHPREIFQTAVYHSAASIILVHNHPAGDLTPDEGDIELTERLVKAGQIMRIEILDHIIINRDNFFSFKEKDLIEFERPQFGIN